MIPSYAWKDRRIDIYVELHLAIACLEQIPGEDKIQAKTSIERG